MLNCFRSCQSYPPWGMRVLLVSAPLPPPFTSLLRPLGLPLCPPLRLQHAPLLGFAWQALYPGVAIFGHVVEIL